MTACPLLQAGRDRGARRGAGAARAGPSRPVPASRAPPDPGARGSSRQRVGRVKCDMPRSGRGGAQAGRGCWLALSFSPTFPVGRSQPGRALPSTRPPPDRPGIPCGGMWLLAGPGGTQLAGSREGGARGAGGSERPGGAAGGGPLRGIPAPPAGSAPTRAGGRRAGVWCG